MDIAESLAGSHIEEMLRASLLSALLVLGCAPAFANMPPPKWDHPFHGKMEKHLVPYGRAAKLCQKLNPGGGSPDSVDGRPLFGCQFWRAKVCVIVYSFDPTGRDALMASNVFRHERAHCNGWPSSHPGALP